MIRNNPDDDFLEQYYQWVIAEITTNASKLNAANHETLYRYYHALASNNTLQPFYQYNWQRRILPMVHLLRTLPRRKNLWKVLDAGCGTGTEALLWASLRDDVKVIGTDISVTRLQTAIARIPFFQQRAKHTLAIEFRDQSIFSILKEQQFDIIWTMEAISHIDPAESFLASASINLGHDGYLVISDSHLMNPIMLWRIFKLRRQDIGHTYKTISTGKSISYAEERLFTVLTLSRLLQQVGFRNISTQLSIFFPPMIARFHRLFSYCTKIDTFMDTVPLARYIGGIYTIIASKL